MAKQPHPTHPVTGKVSLRDIDPGYTGGIEEGDAKDTLAKDVERLAELHDLLYANSHKALLVVLQGMDTSGKDGTIRHVLQGLSPQGTVVSSFKQPSPEELSHDFLWRVHRRVPPLGTIGIFNRSHYEDVLIVRVHGEISDKRARERLQSIRRFERHLAEEDVVIRKFFLHISREEQEKRLQERLEEPRKRWKISAADFAERRRWDEYQAAYEDVLRETSTSRAPWYVIPSDHKWYRNLCVAKVLIEALEGLKMDWPKGEDEELPAD
ncbi:MAG: polyphosphate kinase 2 family protein [Thermaerobacter sp.]|nr:polyphosphate kinase 2 family protein [Thermaerobacter sp.]